MAKGDASARRARRLFTADERARLARALAATTATADLLGRSRIRRRAHQSERHYIEGGRGNNGPRVARFSDAPTDFTCFDDDPILPLAPRSALDYFLRLIPQLGVDPERFGAGHERHAFTLAEDIDGIVLGRVQHAIAEILRTGSGAGRGTEIVQEILDDAGISPQSAGYAENVWRTNAMDAYTTGATRELQDPTVAEYFPVWRYVGIRDGRQRPSHAVHFDRYYATRSTFAEVRDSVKGSFDGYQCRCNFIPIDKHEWAELQRRGASIASFSEPRAGRHGRGQIRSYCQEGVNKGKPGPCPEGDGSGGSSSPATAVQAPAPPPPPAAAAPTEHHRKAEAAVAAAFDANTSLSPAQRQTYKAAAQATIAKLTPRAAERMAAHVAAVRSYRSPDELTAALAKGSPKMAEAVAGGLRAGGGFNARTGELHLDGGLDEPGKKGLAIGGVYAHEFGHAIDGVRGSEISAGKDWQQAWEAEIKVGKLTGYAAEHPAEGFAEFARLVHAGPYPIATIEKHFPRCAAVWRKEGLLA